MGVMVGGREGAWYRGRADVREGRIGGKGRE